MGIQPIDLQTMYSQLGNVSRTLNGGQQVQLTQAMQQQSNIQKNLENSQAVQKTSSNETTSSKINKDGSNNGRGAFNQSQSKQNNQEEADKNIQNSSGRNCSSPYIGTIIDITR